MTLKEHYFAFVTHQNLHKFLYLIDKRIEQNPDEIVQLLTIVVGSLSADLAALVLEHYPVDVQAEVMVFLTELQQYEDNDIHDIEAFFAEKMNVTMGGEPFLKRMLERMDNQEKELISGQIAQKYPEFSPKVSRLIVLFDDLFHLDPKAFEKVFTSLDALVLAPAICSLGEDKRQQVYAVLSPGMRSMIEEFITLRWKNTTSQEIELARKYIIDYALDLEKKQLITIK